MNDEMTNEDKARGQIAEAIANLQEALSLIHSGHIADAMFRASAATVEAALGFVHLKREAKERLNGL